MGILHALSHFFGLDNLSGPTYGFWSGPGSDIGELPLIGGFFVLLRHHNCHEDGCWRLGTHVTSEVNGHQFKRCGRHHRVRHS